MRLCRPRAKGRNPQAASSASLTARQSLHASHDQRDVPPAVARTQMMHRSYSRETSHPSDFSGESSSPHDCRLTGKCGYARLFRCNGPRNPPQGICTDNSVTRCRSAASVALSFRSVIFAIPGNATLGRPPLARVTVPALPLGHRAVEARLPGRRARYPNSRPLVSDSRISEDPDSPNQCLLAKCRPRG